MSRLTTYSAIAAAALALAPWASAGEAPAQMDRSLEYPLKNRSSFNVPDTARPPFWPIGHVKQPRVPGVKITAAPVVTNKLVPESFAVTSILLGNPSLAVINGRSYSEGEFLRSGRGQSKASQPRIRVGRIGDGRVVLQTEDGQSVTVMLHRPELNDRKVDAEAEQLLSDQR